LAEIEDLVPKMNGAELDTPIKALQQNAQYREARELMADEVQRLNPGMRIGWVYIEFRR
jgi:hypothetical protein